MRSNRRIIFGLLIVVGVAVVWWLLKSLSGGGPPPVAQNTNTVLVSTSPNKGKAAKAAVFIPAGAIVTRDMLVMANTDLTQNIVTDPDAQAVGYITKTDIPQGEIVHPADDFVGHISEVGIPGALRLGMRAMVVPIANKPTLHDLVHIGNYVDVLAAFEGNESRVIVQNVRVLAVDVFGSDFPQTNVAMRGPFKADPKGLGINSAPAAPGAGTAAGQPAPAGPDATPTPLPTPVPANAPRPDPALTLEVTPQQAAAIQLALNSNATLDYLLRPSLPGGKSPEVGEGTLIGPDGLPVPGATPIVRNISVTKPQIAPYTTRIKQANQNAGVKTANTFTQGLKDVIKEAKGGGYQQPYYGDKGNLSNSGGGTGQIEKTPPFDVPTPAPTPIQMYTIPVIGDGKVMHSENVPLPGPGQR